jgi:hypothetical protein
MALTQTTYARIMAAKYRRKEQRIRPVGRLDTRYIGQTEDFSLLEEEDRERNGFKWRMI